MLRAAFHASGKRLRAILVNPFASLALFGFILWSAWHVLAAPFDERSIGGGRVHRLLGLPGPHYAESIYPAFPSAFHLREGGRLRVVHPDEESWDTVTRWMTERPDDLLTLSVCIEQKFRGCWAVTRVDHVYSLSHAFGDGFSEGEHDAARKAYMDDLVARHPLPRAIEASLRAQQRHLVVEHRYAGYAVNGASVFALVALAFSLRWVPQTAAWVRGQRRARALARARCPRCGYSIAGLPELKCPECGEDLAPAPARA